MEFKARDAYQKTEVVQEYDRLRFSSVKGRITDWLEKRTIQQAIIRTGLEVGSLFLDIPCGTGRLSRFITENKFKVIASDISHSMVAKSRIKALEGTWSDKANFAVVDAVNLPFLDSTIPAVVSLRLFGHVPPPVRIRMIKEFTRVSRGYVILAYYHRNSIQGFLRRRKRRLAKIPWYPINYTEIKRELKDSGLEIVKYIPLCFGVSETLIVLTKKHMN